MRFSVSQQLLEAMLGYLSERPFKEVAKLIGEFHKDVKPIEEAPEKEEPKA